METCRLTTYADLEWALQQVRSGRTVLVVVPRPNGSRRECSRHLQKMQEYMAEARHEALVSGVRRAQARRFRPGLYVSQFTLSPLPQRDAVITLSDDDAPANDARTPATEDLALDLSG